MQKASLSKQGVAELQITEVSILDSLYECCLNNLIQQTEITVRAWENTSRGHSLIFSTVHTVGLKATGGCATRLNRKSIYSILIRCGNPRKWDGRKLHSKISFQCCWKMPAFISLHLEHYIFMGKLPNVQKFYIGKWVTILSSIHISPCLGTWGESHSERLNTSLIISSAMWCVFTAHLVILGRKKYIYIISEVYQARYLT